MSNNEFSTPKLTPMDGVKIPSVSPTEDSGYILSQEFKEYATLEVNERIDAIAGGIIPKGDILSTDLPTASEENMGWMYYLTDLGYKVISDGTQWVQFSDNMVTQTITDGDTAHAPSSDAVYDALQERVAADDDLQSQIINLNTDVATLDAIVGGKAEVENTDPSEGQSILASSRLIHHVNLLPSGEFGLVGARDIKWNQYVQTQYININVTCADLTDNASVYYRDGACSFSRRTSPNKLRIKVSYAGYANISNLRIIVSEVFNSHIVVYPVNGEYDAIVTLTRGNTFDGVGIRGTVIDSSDTTAYNLKFNVTDVTEMGEDGITIAQFKEKFPSLYPYHAPSIINLNPTGFSIRGINLWDETWEGGSFNTNTGVKGTGSAVTSKTYIPVLGGTSYHFLTGGKTMYVFQYDAEKNYLGSTTYFTVNNTNRTLEANCAYIQFEMAGSYGTTYNHDIQIADNSLPSSLKIVYHPYNGQTVPVSISGHYVNENVYDYVTNKMVDGVLRGEVHTKVGTIALGSMNWVQDGSYMLSNSLSGIAKFPSSNANLGNMLCDVFMPVEFTRLNSNTRISMMQSGYVAVYGSTAPTSGNLYYELATEVVTYTEPLRSFSLTDYATIEPITPQTIANRIDVPFSVLSKSNNGLIQQIAQNTADIADNKQILSQHEARLSNLEQISGDYVTEDMQDYSTTPTGKASYALVETMKGVSRVENQLMNKSSLRPTNSDNGITCTNNGDGTFTVSGTATGASYTYFYADGITLNPNHSYFVVGNTYTRVAATVNGSTSYFSPASALISGASQLTQIFNNIPSGTTVNFKLQVVLVDLTLYFNGGTVPTLAEIQQKHPELLEPRSYNAGEIVDAIYTSVTSRGVNIFDGVMESGKIDSSGQNEADANSVRSKNMIPVRPSTNYYFTQPMHILEYDANEDLVLDVGDYSTAWNYTTQASTHYMRFYWDKTLIDQDHIQICLNSYADKTTYHPYMTDQLAIPSVTLRSAGSVSDTLDVESGEITRNVGTYEFTGNESGWDTLSGDGVNQYWISSSSPFVGKLIANEITITCSRWKPILIADRANNYGTAYLTSSGYPAFNISTSEFATLSAFKTFLQQQYANGTPVTINYALATPSTDSVSPTLDNTLKTEGGGSVFTDADVDGQFTLGFLNL